MSTDHILSRSIAILVLLLVGLGFSPARGAPTAPQAQYPPTTEMVSVASDGAQANDYSDHPSISADGRFVVFHTDATNLVDADTNGKMDVFVHDRETGETTRVSVASDGAQGDGHSYRPSISADGRFVAFASDASNLVIDTNEVADIFIYDRQTGQTTRVSVHSNGAQGNGNSWTPSVSADGRYVAFWSSASNLIGSDLDGDGTCEVSEGCDTNALGDIFVHDRQTGQTERVSVRSDGAQALSYSCQVYPSISADGRYVAFASLDPNLVNGDTNGMEDVFVHDRQTGQTTRVSISSAGAQGNGSSVAPSVSADGRYVAFQSAASNLVADDTNNSLDVFAYDRQTLQILRVSVHSNGAQANYGSSYASISASGRYVSFWSLATNLVDGDTNGCDDFFLHDWRTGQTTRVSLSDSGAQAQCSGSDSRRPATSGDGRYVAFPSTASDLVSGDTNGKSDVFVRDRGGTGVLVQDEASAPVPGAQVFRNGELAGTTGADGTLVIPDLQINDTLVARFLVTDVGTVKGNHSQDATQDWAYRVYITSLDVPQNGEPTPFTVADPNATQVLTLKKANTLAGFNILASVEWDATAAYLNALRQSFELASAYLYDASDGQMLFERVTIYDNVLYWADADYHLQASNTILPHADAGAVISSTQNAYVYLGRYWNGNTARQGDWTQPDGYRTQIHEFGHYGLWLFDSYYYWGPGGVKTKGHCTSAAIHTNLTSAVNATLMDYQYNATELAMQGVAGLWSGECSLTAQFQHHSQSDWETIAYHYRDWQNPARWTLKTPATYGGVVVGPTAIPVSGWLRVTEPVNVDDGACATPPVIVGKISGAVVPTATVSLQRSGSAEVIWQGESDANGRLEILGAGPGDTVNVFQKVGDKWAHGSVTVACPTRSNASIASSDGDLEVILTPDPFSISVSAWPGSGASEISITLQTTATLAAPPDVFLQQTGMTATLPITLTFDGGLWQSSAALDANWPQVGVIGVVATNTLTQTVTSFLPFDISEVDASQDSRVWSSDGRAELYLPAGVLSVGGRLSISPEGIPGPAPDGMLILGSPYTLRAGEGVTLTGWANLSLFYDGLGDALVRVRLFGAALYRWDGVAWQALDSTFDADQQYAAAPVDDFGVYALLTSSAPIFPVYLPVIVR